MRLSEAMRLGAMLRPQGFGVIVNVLGHTCALGAAFDAAGLLDHGVGRCDPRRIENVFPILHTPPVACPVCRARATAWLNTSTATFADSVAHLNDDHQWTRERIADWVATHEPAEAESAPADLVAVGAAVRGTPEV